MKQSEVTIVHRIDEADRLRHEDLLRRMGSSAQWQQFSALSEVHFLSCCTVAQLDAEAPAYVIAEFSIDGTRRSFLGRLVADHPDLIEQLFKPCTDYPADNAPASIRQFLEQGCIDAHTFHRGTPDRTVAQIALEQQMHQRLSRQYQQHLSHAGSRRELWMNLTQQLCSTDRKHVADTPTRSFLNRWNLFLRPVRGRLSAILWRVLKALLIVAGLVLAWRTLNGNNPYTALLLGIPLVAMLLQFCLSVHVRARHLRRHVLAQVIGHILWRCVLNGLLVTAVLGWSAGLWSAGGSVFTTATYWATILALLIGLFAVLLLASYLIGHWTGLVIGTIIAALVCIALILGYTSTTALLLQVLGIAAFTTLLIAAAALWIAIRIRAQESSAPVDHSELDQAHYQRVTAREDEFKQNHLASVTEIRNGVLPLVLLSAVLRAIHLASVLIYNRGYLGGIPAIHFARFIILPDKRRLLFLANYNGTFNGYLGDFKDSAGATAIWSNTSGFPRSLFLLFEGAQDEEHFKRYARNSQIESLVWFSAYPDLSIREIDRASATRRDLKRPLDNGAGGYWQTLRQLITNPLTETDLAAALNRLD